MARSGEKRQIFLRDAGRRSRVCRAATAAATDAELHHGETPAAYFGVDLQRPGRFCVSPRFLIQKFAVPAVAIPTLSSSQSKRPFCEARLYEIVLPEVSTSAKRPSKSFDVELL